MYEKKSNLKKIISMILAGSMATVMLAGCTDNGKDADENSGKVSISVGNWPAADSQNYQVQAELVEKFNELYPDIEIVGDEYRYDVQSYLPKAEGGTLPTLYQVHFTEVGKILDGGYAADITKQYKDYGYFEKTNEFVLENIIKDNSIYFIPASMYTLGIVANVEIFREAGFVNEDGTLKAPADYNELAQMAQSIKEKTGKAGFLLPTTNNAGGWNFNAIAWNYGTKFMEKQNGKWKATFNTAETAEALQFVKDLKWKYDCFPASTLINADDAMKLVGSGQCAMAFAHPEQAEWMTKYGIEKENIAMLKMPAGPKDHTTLMGGSLYVIREDATEEEKDAAFKWLSFIGVTPNADETAKANIDKQYKNKADKERMVGLIDLCVWNEESDQREYIYEVVNKYINVPQAHVSNYNDKTDMQFRIEEPVCAQELYAILDRCIQEVLTNENADCGALLEQAAKDFQTNFLDYEE